MWAQVVQDVVSRSQPPAAEQAGPSMDVDMAGAASAPTRWEPVPTDRGLDATAALSDGCWRQAQVGGSSEFDEVPLFATRPPPQGLPPALQAQQASKPTGRRAAAGSVFP